MMANMSSKILFSVAAFLAIILMSVAYVCMFEQEHSYDERREALGVYQKIRDDMLKLAYAEDLESEAGCNYGNISVDKVRNIAMSRGASEVYISNRFNNIKVDLAIPEAVIVRLSDGRYWFLIGAGLGRANPSNSVNLDDYSRVGSSAAQDSSE